MMCNLHRHSGNVLYLSNIIQTGDFGVAAQLTRTMSKRNTVCFAYLIKLMLLNIQDAVVTSYCVSFCVTLLIMVMPIVLITF